MPSEMKRVLLTKRKSTATSSPSQLMAPLGQRAGSAPGLGSSPVQIKSSTDTAFVSSHSGLSSPTVEREISHPTQSSPVKSEFRSQSPAKSMGYAALQDGAAIPAPSIPAHGAATLVDSLISSMVDSTEYASPSAKSPPVPCGINASDEQVLQKFATNAAALPFIPTEVGTQQPLGDSMAGDCALATPPMTRADGRRPFELDEVMAGSAETTASASVDLPRATSLSFHDYWEHSSFPSTPTPRSNQRPAQISSISTLGNTKTRSSRSLYPHPRTTVSAALRDNNVARKRARTARSEHPERYLYAGNTFNKLDDRTFHQTAQSNPYLSQLTVDASRPVYKCALEARQALQALERPASPSPEPVGYDQQITALVKAIAEMRKKYAYSKIMTSQAGIEVEGNLWDRLSNIVQYPPDLDAYVKKGHGEIDQYADDMKAWDRAIGQQIIIKKRIVYKEALEKLQGKLDILQAEKALKASHMRLKRKADEVIDADEDSGLGIALSNERSAE